MIETPLGVESIVDVPEEFNGKTVTYRALKQMKNLSNTENWSPRTSVQ